MSNEDSIRAGAEPQSGSPTDNKRNELANADDNEPQGRGELFHRAHFLHHDLPRARQKSPNGREGHGPRRELHRHARRREDGWPRMCGY